MLAMLLNKCYFHVSSGDNIKVKRIKETKAVHFHSVTNK